MPKAKKQKEKPTTIGIWLEADGLTKTTPDKAVFYQQATYVGDRRISEIYGKVLPKE